MQVDYNREITRNKQVAVRLCLKLCTVSCVCWIITECWKKNRTELFWHILISRKAENFTVQGASKIDNPDVFCIPMPKIVIRISNLQKSKSGNLSHTHTVG